MATVRTFPFEFTGADGGPLRGEIRTGAARQGGPAVVICHGFKGFKDWGFFPHLATRVARAGITAVTFNFSGSGIGPDRETFSEPERFGHATFSGDLQDLDLVVNRLTSGGLVPDLSPTEEIGIFGHSRGGATAVLHASQHSACKCLVTWATIASNQRWDQPTIRRWRAEGKLDVVNMRTGEVLPMYTDVLDDLAKNGDTSLNILKMAGAVRVPWLIVHGDADESVGVEDARRLHRVSENVSTLQIVSAGTHTFGARHPWGGSTRELDEAMDATVEWFSRHLLR